ncbi:hypothetical protein EJ05DRAFT_535594 [Pseudovirgaria hyperparasitica]|uniref:Uncharacterized protein n=1 Tax=Pseudovirgaria hyperparasitica TaxID=470096 RepID=A0A6A6WJF2_9PEZI|nr:uncharacterized protein EJ05DRAFT_535594 [Pseudovirgaria hyperparasitica]KAF2762374.1 hypothetical protein EJ05DRAFT_535594 [Pseudovirgaria hyperparasitica]
MFLSSGIVLFLALLGTFIIPSLAVDEDEDGSYALHHSCDQDYPRARYALNEAIRMARIAATEMGRGLSPPLLNTYKLIFEQSNVESGPSERFLFDKVRKTFKEVSRLYQDDWAHAEIKIYCDDRRWSPEVGQVLDPRDFPNNVIPDDLLNPRRDPDLQRWVDLQTGEHRVGVLPCKSGLPDFHDWRSTWQFDNPDAVTFTWCGPNWHDIRHRTIELDLMFANLSDVDMDHITIYYLSHAFLIMILLAPRFHLRGREHGWFRNIGLVVEEAVETAPPHALFAALCLLDRMDIGLHSNAVLRVAGKLERRNPIQFTHPFPPPLAQPLPPNLPQV